MDNNMKYWPKGTRVLIIKNDKSYVNDYIGKVATIDSILEDHTYLYSLDIDDDNFYKQKYLIKLDTPLARLLYE